MDKTIHAAPSIGPRRKYFVPFPAPKQRLCARIYLQLRSQEKKTPYLTQRVIGIKLLKQIFEQRAGAGLCGFAERQRPAQRHRRHPNAIGV